LRVAQFYYLFAAELDLDYLEKRGGNTITYQGADSGSKEEDSPADTLDRVKIIFLGAPGVGKTSIIRVRSFNYPVTYAKLDTVAYEDYYVIMKIIIL